MESKIIKVLLAVALSLCLFRMPIWYFQLIRIFGTIGFAYLAYLEYKDKRKGWFYIFGSCAIVLNPVKEISFDKHTWKYIDVIMATTLLINLIAIYKTFLFQKLKSANGKTIPVEKVKKVVFPLVILIGFAIIVVGLPRGFNSIFPKPPTLYEKMLNVKEQLNLTAPQDVSSSVTWDSVTVWGKSFVLCYTIFNDKSLHEIAHNRRELYDYLSSENFQLENYTEFCFRLDTLKNVKKLYENLTVKYKNELKNSFELGSLQDFESKVSNEYYKKFQEDLRQKMIPIIKNNKELTLFRKNNVTWRYYHYSIEKWDFFGGIVITPADYK